jgi:phenylacetate-CoA ligase
LTYRGALYSAAQRALGTDYSGAYRAIKETTQDEGHLAKGVESSLKDLLVHARREVPYYRAILKDMAHLESDSVDLSMFRDVPQLTRETVRDHFHNLVSDDYARRRVYMETTGGSTGEPLRLLKDREGDRWSIASMMYYYQEMLGMDFFRTKKILIGSPAPWPRRGPKRSATDWLTGTVRMDGLILTEPTLHRYVKRLNSFQPDLIEGVAGMLYELSQFIQRRGLVVRSPKAIISEDEMLYDFMREAMEDAFGSKVYNLYGSVEAGLVAGECGSGSMHVFEYDNLVEVIDGRVGGGFGDILVTPLHNFAMPLIRYRTEDEALVSASKCGCGSVLPTLGKIEGRTLDYFVREDGGLVHGYYFFRLMRKNPSVRAFQIVQEEYRAIRITLQADRVDDGWKRSVEDWIRLAFSSDCRVAWELVDSIPRTPRGKRRFIVSRVRHP